MPILEIHNLTHIYPSGRIALKNVSLQINSGERVALVGTSGSGKSTLLREINGLLIPSEGSLKVFGERIADAPESQKRLIRRRIGMIFQEFALIERLSVQVNVLVGRLGYQQNIKSVMRIFPAKDVALARELIRKVGLEGYEETPVRRLSGGQKQRVGIARALAQEPEIILGDEPTANLDLRTSDEILSLLIGLTEEQGATLILSLHDIRAARKYCTRVVALRSGEIAWDGPSEEFDDAAVGQIFYSY